MRAVLSTLALAALAACAAPVADLPPGGGPGRLVDPKSGKPVVLVPDTAPVGWVLVPPTRAEAEALLARPPRLMPSRGLPTAESSPTGDELALVSTVLSELQGPSFAGNREFCGYIGLDRAGALVATPASTGAEAMCALPSVPAGLTLVASFHTHGGYSPLYPSEWPTTQDMLTDASDDIDGYIATPGGRLWHVDTDTMTAREICGRGCLPQDPAYVAAEDGPLRPVLTWRDLLAWELGL